MKTHIFLFALLSMLLCGGLSAQPVKQKIDMHIDSLGNARLQISMTLSAAAWQNWVQTAGNNPALLKRQIEREMPGYFLDDFKLEKNDMERSFDLSLKAYGVCKVDKRGRWMLETDDKDIDLTELDERKYMYVANPAELGGQVQQTTMLFFPDEARDIKVDKDAFGKTVFVFDMDNPTSGGFNWMTWAGIALMLAGLGWGVAKLFA